MTVSFDRPNTFPISIDPKSVVGIHQMADGKHCRLTFNGSSVNSYVNSALVNGSLIDVCRKLFGGDRNA